MEGVEAGEVSRANGPSIETNIGEIPRRGANTRLASGVPGSDTNDLVRYSKSPGIEHIVYLIIRMKFPMHENFSLFRSQLSRTKCREN